MPPLAHGPVSARHRHGLSASARLLKLSKYPHALWECTVLEFLGPDLAETARHAVKVFVGMTVRLSPIYVVSMLVIAYALYRIRRIEGSFLSWLLPREIYLHKSHMTDLKLFVFGRVVVLLRLFSSAGIRTLIAATILVALGGRLDAEAGAWVPFATTLAVLLVSDFSTYWIHRIHHQTAYLWPFHEVHHSAEVMTPVTVYRKHPVYDILGGLLRNCLMGVLFGFWTWVFAGKIAIVHIAGASVLYVMFHMAGSNFRHSHIWISYGPFWERIFISPAQHQIHHSIALEHRDKNFGEVFAFWDWMFGTLYRPTREEALTFGLSDETGAPIAQPHDGLIAAIVRPFQDSWRALRGQTPPPTPPKESPTKG